MTGLVGQILMILSLCVYRQAEPDSAFFVDLTQSDDEGGCFLFLQFCFH